MGKKKPNIFIRIFFNPKVFALGLLALLVAISIPISKNISKRYTIDQEIKDLEKEIEELEAGNRNLKKMIDYLESDQFAEEQARLKLGLKKPGEEVVVIDEEEHNGPASNGGEVTGGEENDDFSNPVLWWRYFFQNKKGL